MTKRIEMKSERKEPEFIECSDLAKIGYPFTYTILQQGLEAIGWWYDIGTDCWYPPQKESIAEFTAEFEKAFAAANAKRGLHFRQPLTNPPRKIS